jgi:hypothetical protein
MDVLSKKYPALRLPKMYVRVLVSCREDDQLSFDPDCEFKRFKQNVSALGLNSSEYKKCIEWFCLTLGYTEK